MLRADDVTAPAEGPGCERCGEPTAEPFVVWGHGVCAACLAAWSALPYATSGAVERALGIAWGPGGWTRNGEPLDFEERGRLVCAEYRARAAAWVAEQGRGAAPPRAQGAEEKGPGTYAAHRGRPRLVHPRR